MSQKHPDFSILAARIAVSNLHKNTSDSFFETCKVCLTRIHKMEKNGYFFKVHLLHEINQILG